MMFRSRLCVSIFRCFLLLAANSPKLYETTVTGFIWPRLISQKSMYSLASPFSWHFFSSCLLRTPQALSAKQEALTHDIVSRVQEYITILQTYNFHYLHGKF